ncbi:MAG: ABC transporter substrate-binding protein, partial [Desulfobacterales bacterium]|nr:ABC transporter substrate-binding protein [Desulfobacterales bacterium]
MLKNSRKADGAARLFLLLALIAACGLYSCMPPESPGEQRARRAEASRGDIVIGVVESSPLSDNFKKGAALAIRELNEKGGVLGRPLSAIHRDDRGDVGRGLEIAREFAKNPDMVAVVGRRGGNMAIAASVTYEENGMVFIAAGATNPVLTREEADYTFRNIPSDKEIARETAMFAWRSGCWRIAIVYDSESSGKRVSEIFRDQADNLGMTIVAEKTYARWENDLKTLVADLMKGDDFDAIFLSGELPSAAYLIKQMREMGVTQPILGGHHLDSPVLAEITGQSDRWTIVPTVFHPGSPAPPTRTFVKNFTRAFKTPPGTWAAQGYDAIRILARAMENGGSTTPGKISAELRFLTGWEGVTGSYSFTSDGNIAGKAIYFKIRNAGGAAFLGQGEGELESHPGEGRDAVLKLPISGKLETIDPGLLEDMLSIEISEQLFLGLTDFDPYMYGVAPELATDWIRSKDGAVYTFHLRKDAKWTNGTEVTADDVVFAIQRNIKPETKSPYAKALFILKNAERFYNGEIDDVTRVGVRAMDRHTVRFTLEHPAAFFPAMAGLNAFRPLPRAIVDAWGDRWTEPENIQTNGSYKLAGWKRGEVMILKKNPDYYNAENVSIPEVHYYVIEKSADGLAKYKKRELDVMGGHYLPLLPADIKTIMSDPNLLEEYHQAPQFCTYAFAFNTRRWPMDSPLVRKAISAAIDRRLIIQVTTGADLEIASTFTRPPVFGAVDPGEGVGIKFNPVQAKRWLAEAGFPDGQGFPEITLVYNENELHKRVARAVQLLVNHHLNIKIKLHDLEWKKFVAATKSNFTGAMIRYPWCADYPDANNWLNDRFNMESPNNPTGWYNREFIDLMDLARRNSHPQERKRMY